MATTVNGFNAPDRQIRQNEGTVDYGEDDEEIVEGKYAWDTSFNNQRDNCKNKI